MEWPNIEVVTVDDEDRYNYYGTDPAGERLEADRTATLVTKEIYARAAKAAIANILVDHSSTGLEAKVHAFLERLHEVGDDETKWNTEYRNVARSFAELMAEATPLARTLEICRGGLDAVHDLLKYRLPRDDFDFDGDRDRDPGRGGGSDTVLSARDAFVLCQSFPKLSTRAATGTRPPDLSYRYGLLTVSPDSNEAYAGEGMKSNSNGNSSGNHHNRDHDNSGTLTVYGNEACERIAELRQAGQLETSASSLACHTLTNHELVASLADKTFVVVGCDHPLAPTKSLLRIPGVTVLGIPASRSGLDDLLEYVAYNAPDDSAFVYPDLDDVDDGDGDCGGNPVLSRGPHVAQWILDNTKFLRDDDDEVDNHLSLYARTNAGSELVLVPMPLPSPTVDAENPDDPSNAVSTRVRESSIRWAAASDLVVQRVLRARSESVRCSVWSYQSSTTCMVVPAASTTKSSELLRSRPFHEPYLHKLSLGTVLKPAVEDRVEEKKEDDPDNTTTTTKTTKTKTTKTRRDNHDYTIVNGILTLEGPHHMLAEHIRLWRAIATSFPDEYQGYATRDADDGDPSETEYHYDDDDDDEIAGSRREVYVFAPHVPLSLAAKSSTELVARENARLLDDPLRIFDAGVVASTLAAIGIAGLADPIVNRPMPCVLTSGEEDTTPFAMFWYGSFHGGIWNCPYTLESVSGTVGYVLGKAYEYYHYYAAAAAPKDDDDDDDRSPQSADAASGGREGEQEDVDLPDFVRERLEMFAGP